MLTLHCAVLVGRCEQWHKWENQKSLEQSAGHRRACESAAVVADKGCAAPRADAAKAGWVRSGIADEERGCTEK